MDGLPIRCSCSLLGDAHQLRLRFAKERFPAPGAVDASMTDHHKEVLFRKDACVCVGHLVGTSRTGKRTGLALTERTGCIRAPTHVIKLESGSALLGQHMTHADPFQQVLPLEMGKV